MKNNIKKSFFKAAIIICFILLLMYPQIVTTGAANGLTLWFYNVIPALFPAMLLTQLTMQIFNDSLKNPLPFVLITGLICGYPIGAVSVTMLNKKHKNLPAIYNNLMPYINVASPAFILNYVLMMGLSGSNKKLLLICVYVPIAICIIFTLAIGRIKNKNTFTLSTENNDNPTKKNVFEIFESAIMFSLESMAKLGAYIIICAVLCQFIMNFPLSVNLKCVFCGFLEITTGIYFLSLTSFSPAAKLILVCCFCAFGGISCLGQTYIVSGKYLHIKKYICKKLVLTAVTAIFTSFVAYVFLL